MGNCEEYNAGRSILVMAFTAQLLNMQLYYAEHMHDTASSQAMLVEYNF